MYKYLIYVAKIFFNSSIQIREQSFDFRGGYGTGNKETQDQKICYISIQDSGFPCNTDINVL